jgi:Alpha-galactosidase
MNIKKRVFLGVVLSCLVTCLFARNVLISTPATSLVLSAPEKGELKYIYYGARLSEIDFCTIADTEKAVCAVYPVYGLNCPSETVLAVKHSDGNMTLQLEIVKIEKSCLDKAELTVISLKDKIYPFYVKMYYKAYQDVDIIEIWSEISHQEKKAVILNQFASACLPVRKGNVWLSHLYGAWANEGRLAEEPLKAGMKVIKNKDGVRNSHTAHAEVMFSLDGKPRENTGRVIGAALCYSGNYKLRIDTDESDYHYFFAGINEENSSYSLKKNEVFRTPELALTYSNEGLSGSSRNFHRWARLYKLANGTKLRKILLNSWEGVYFKINESGMNQMMSDIASMGGELFVMDDGWFGSKYPRKTDRTSLGDWVVDSQKLPSGLKGLIDNARKHGIKFGIWIEPEMTNTRSELYEKHPDWVLKAPGRDLVTGRGGTQAVLDLANPEVQDFIFGVVDSLMTDYPEIDYIKWDANMAIWNHGSNYLDKEEQNRMYIDYHRGFENICQRIRAKYPELTMQACAQGGGRANYGVLPYFDEFWVSDNTDALQRIYMQWGTSYFFPAIAMASHISASPNHQTFRCVPLKYRVDVAMSGRLGMEIQPRDMTEEEKAFCKKAIAEYKKIRPVVQQGDIYRLISPYEKSGVASLMYTSPEKDKAVLYWWKLEHFHNQHLPRVLLAGLFPESNYRIYELNRIDKQPLSVEGKILSGAYLMETGIELPNNHIVDKKEKNEYASRILYLEKVE